MKKILITSPSKKFEINKENLTITIKGWIESLDFYEECMEIWSEPIFMDFDIPLESNYSNDYFNVKIYPINGWKIKNTYLMTDQKVVSTIYFIDEV